MPHLTLLGGLPDTPATLAQVTALGALLRPLDLALLPPACGDRWFHCIFVPVQPSAALDAAQQHAQRLLDQPPRPLPPHLSLLYGAPDPARHADAIAHLPPLPGVARCAALALVDVRGPAEAWRERARIALR